MTSKRKKAHGTQVTTFDFLERINALENDVFSARSKLHEIAELWAKYAAEPHKRQQDAYVTELNALIRGRSDGKPCEHANTRAAPGLERSSVWCPDCSHWVVLT